MYNCARCARRQQRKKNGTVVVSVHYCRVRTREWVLQESGYVRRSDVQFYLTPIYGKKRYTVLPDTNFTACYLATSVITGNYRPGYDGWSRGGPSGHTLVAEGEKRGRGRGKKGKGGEEKREDERKERKRERRKRRKRREGQLFAVSLVKFL